MKKLYLLLAMVLIAGLVLAGCASSASPAPATSAKPSAVTTPPTATAAPPVTSTAPAASQGSSAKPIKIGAIISLTGGPRLPGPGKNWDFSTGSIRSAIKLREDQFSLQSKTMPAVRLPALMPLKNCFFWITWTLFLGPLRVRRP